MVYSVMIVDDNPAIQYQLRRIFDEQPDFHVCAEAGNGQEAVEAAERIAPDGNHSRLVDARHNGLDAAKILKKSIPKTKVVLFSDHATIFSARNARSRGIAAVVSKSEKVDELIAKTREVAQRK